MGLCSWIVFGALAGWVASMITGRNSQMGCLANIIIGIVGAALGGLLVTLLGGGGITGFNLPSFLVAVLAASLLLLITGWYQVRR